MRDDVNGEHEGEAAPNRSLVDTGVRLAECAIFVEMVGSDRDDVQERLVLVCEALKRLLVLGTEAAASAPVEVQCER